MSPSQIPQANVYDIRSLKEIPPLKYFLDTNVLKFVFARTVISEKGYQAKYYPHFFKSLLKEKFLRFTFTQNLLELFSVVDKLEEQFSGIKVKVYRRDNLEQYISTRQGIWDDIERSLNIFSANIDQSKIEAYFKIDFSIDLYDYVYYQLASSNDTAFVTDDFEFIYIKDINVFTANENAIQAAYRVRKLVDN